MYGKHRKEMYRDDRNANRRRLKPAAALQTRGRVQGWGRAQEGGDQAVAAQNGPGSVQSGRPKMCVLSSRVRLSTQSEQAAT